MSEHDRGRPNAERWSSNQDDTGTGENAEVDTTKEESCHKRSAKATEAPRNYRHEKIENGKKKRDHNKPILLAAVRVEGNGSKTQTGSLSTNKGY